MTKATGFLSVTLLAASTAFAQPAQQHGTMSQAIESVSTNLASNPQSEGLGNALDQLIENAAKHSIHHQEKAVERTERAERAERAERPDRAERPERPERPERVVRAERPDRPGKGH